MTLNTDLIYDAISREIYTWADITRQIIGDVTLPSIPDNSNLLKAAIWFNFGLDAGKNLMPSIAFIAGKAALPLWLASSAQKYYQNYYSKKLNSAYDMLNIPYQNFQGELINGITQAERQFTVTDYYYQIEQTLLSLYKTQEKKDRTAWIEVIRRLIERSKIINTNQNELRQIVKRNLDEVAGNLIRVYEGAQAGNLLYVSNDSEVTLPTGTAIRTESCRKIPQHSPFEIPDGFIQIDYRNEADLAWLYTNAHALKTTRVDYFWWDPCLDTTYVKPLPPGQASVEKQLTTSYRKATDLLTQAFRDLQPTAA